MQPTLVAALLLCVGLAVAGVVLGFRRSSGAGGDPRARAMALVTGAILVPVLAFALWNQSRAAERLTALGITLHPAATHAIGLATGRGQYPSWLFAVSGDTAISLDWYGDSTRRRGWEIGLVTPDVATLHQGPRRLVILSAPGSGTLSYAVMTREP